MNKERPVLLLRIESPDDGNKFFPPYGLLYISAALDNIGTNTKIFHDYESDKLFKEIEEYITVNNPLWVGFSVITNKGLMSSLRLSRLLKKKYPTLPIVWGGIHPTLSGEQTIIEESIDYIITNEGEMVAQELTKDLIDNNGILKNMKIPGLGYTLDKEIMINPINSFVTDLDQFNIDFGKIDIERYISTDPRWTGKIFPMITSRGCPFRCKFCYNQAVNKQRWRAHSVEYVRKQIEYLVKEYDIRNFQFYDDNFFVNKERGLEIIKYVPGQWLGELRSNYFNDDFIKQIKEGGCNLAFIGAESGNDRVLKEVINKGATKQDCTNAVTISKKYNLNIGLSFIIGFPGETREEMFDTLEYIYELTKIYPSANIDLHIFKAYPGTPLYYDALAAGLEKTEKLEDWADERHYQEHADSPWVEDQKELENIRDVFSLFILLNKKRGRITDVLKIFSFLEVLRIKLRFYKFPFEIKMAKWLKVIS